MQKIILENESCPACGENPIVVNQGNDGLACDSDLVCCPECSLVGYISVDVGLFVIHWDGE